MLSVAANSDRMTIGANRLEGLKVDLKIADLWGAKIVSGFAQLGRAEVGGQSLTGVKLTATGNASASDLELSGNARGLAISARGRLFGGPADAFRACELYRSRAAASASRSRGRRP